MSKMSKSFVTIAIIFGTAFILAAMGCSEEHKTTNTDTQKNDNANSAEDRVDSNNDSRVILKPVDPDLVRLCSSQEKSDLDQWKTQIDKANSLIDQTGSNSSQWKKSTTAIKESVTARSLCITRLNYHRDQPCKTVTKNIIKPEPITHIFDEFHVHQKCLKVTKYANQFVGADQNSSDHSNQPPILPQPAPMPFPDQSKIPADLELPECSNAEFDSLREWSAQLTLSDKAILTMGDNFSGWKYNANAIDFATQANQTCEKLINYHAAKPCQRNIKQNDGSVLNRIYKQDTIAQRCQRSRAYFYEFQQHKTSLMVRNAYLFVDMTGLSKNVFEPNSFSENGNCIIENRTASTIDYSTQKAMVKDTRGFESKMIVLETTEGLVIQCYGLEIDGPFSKNEVVRLLKAKNTNLKLEYVLK